MVQSFLNNILGDKIWVVSFHSFKSKSNLILNFNYVVKVVFFVVKSDYSGIKTRFIDVLCISWNLSSSNSC